MERSGSELVLGKFGSKPFQTQFELKPNCKFGLGLGKSWEKLNGLVCSLAIWLEAQTISNSV